MVQYLKVVVEKKYIYSSSGLKYSLEVLVLLNP